MSQEIKSIDVTNEAEDAYVQTFLTFGWKLKSSQRVYNQDTALDGAISYKGFTYVQTTTTTLDFTKLVFERSTTIPFYEELCDLENEFWSKCKDIENERPITPPNSLEKWAHQAYPDIRTAAEKRLPHIIGGCVSLILFVTFMFCSSLLSEWGELFALILPLLLIFSVALWVGSCKLSRHRALKIALLPAPSKFRTRLKKRYDMIWQQIEFYDNTIKEINIILEKAEKLRT